MPVHDTTPLDAQGMNEEVDAQGMNEEATA